MIAERLTELCKDHPTLDILLAQWIYDEKLISKALSTITTIFPHYSRHDFSHSKQIITNIERILGFENIQKLSATDLWLILESAFCHDIGMVIPMKKIQQDWNSDEFKEFLSSIKINSRHELYSITKKYHDKKPVEIFSNTQWPLEVFEEIRLLLAEFYRKSHAVRSEEIINNPWDEVGLNSPRNELLPKRLFKTLGKICSHHGHSFEDVMSLPKKEVGIGTDDAHPRYIACLLRLGDLLDLDDNRFCPVMLSMVGNIPNSTAAHIEKHLSIEHFRMDQSRIEVSAICNTYDGYTETINWFTYIEQEINLQMMHWHDIVPTKSMGLLPTIGSLDVQLKNYELLSRNEVPNFGVDEEKMFELLQGSGIYEKPIQCVREILQNATDATLLKFWFDADTKKKYSNLNMDIPTPDISTILHDNYAIEINIQEHLSENNTTTWNIQVKDKGIGIDLERLGFLQTIGSSNRDIEKEKLVSSMPFWLKPSGAFGIGFQSIFLITDEVKIRSKGLYSGQGILLNSKNPRKFTSGNLFIKKITDSFLIDTGTNIEILWNTPRIPESFSYSYNDKDLLSEINNYDFIEKKPLNIGILKFIHEIHKFSAHSYIPINLTFQESKIELPKLELDSSGHFHESGFRIKKNGFGNNHYDSSLFFKGQPLETNFSTKFYLLDVDILSYKANEILELNRNKIKKSEAENVLEKISKSAIEYLTSSIEINDQNEKEHINAFTITQHRPTYFLSSDYPYDTKPDIAIEGTPYTTKEIIESANINLNIRDYINPKTHKRHNMKVKKISDGFEITIDKHHSDTTIELIQEYLLAKHYSGITLSHYKNVNHGVNEYSELKLSFNNTKEIIIKDDVMKHLTHRDSNFDRWPRLSFICPDEFSDLSVNKDSIGFTETLNHILSYKTTLPSANLMIFPFKSGDRGYEPYNLDKLIEWTYKNRIRSNTTKVNIRAEYLRFIEYIKGL
jgi:hypothetical protein